MTVPAAGRRRATQAVIERLLEPYDLWKSGTFEWRSCCPFHKGDNNTAFRIRASGHWRCYKCDAHGDLEALVGRLKGLTFQQARAYVGNLPAAFTSLEDRVALPPYEERHKRQDPYPTLSEAAIVIFKKHCPVYLLNRGFSENALREFEIGYNYQQSRIVIPVRDVNRKLVGITLRLDFDGSGPKYWHDHFDKSLHLYGFFRWAGVPVPRLFLVEGQLDVVRMHQLGLPACGILGSSISDAQVELLLERARCEELVLMYDNDEAGEKATSDSIRRLSKGRFGRILRVAKYAGKDPGELVSPKQIGVQPWVASLHRQLFARRRSAL